MNAYLVLTYDLRPYNITEARLHKPIKPFEIGRAYSEDELNRTTSELHLASTLEEAIEESCKLINARIFECDIIFKDICPPAYIRGHGYNIVKNKITYLKILKEINYKDLEGLYIPAFYNKQRHVLAFRNDPMSHLEEARAEFEKLKHTINHVDLAIFLLEFGDYTDIESIKERALCHMHHEIVNALFYFYPEHELVKSNLYDLTAANVEKYIKDYATEDTLDDLIEYQSENPKYMIPLIRHRLREKDIDILKNPKEYHSIIVDELIKAVDEKTCDEILNYLICIKEDAKYSDHSSFLLKNFDKYITPITKILETSYTNFIKEADETLVLKLFNYLMEEDMLYNYHYRDELLEFAKRNIKEINECICTSKDPKAKAIVAMHSKQYAKRLCNDKSFIVRDACIKHSDHAMRLKILKTAGPSTKQRLAYTGDAAILDALINIDNEFIQLAIVAQGRKKDLITLTNTPYKSVLDVIYHSGCIPAIKELNKKRRFL